jgi:TolB-like protein/Tfp pilus assembly protein PilF
MRRPPTACQGVVPPVTEPSHAVFLSYASQDAEAAQRICEALRGAGIEVWFDQSALRGGDVWDQTIRKQIKTCVLFIPIISRHTHERDEGYFRLEWKLAVDRSHLMTTNKAFLLPVVVDDTREDDENVPDRFRDIHWTRLPGGETPPAFVERVRRLVSPEPSHGPTTTALAAAPGSAATPLTRERVATPWRSKRALPMVLALVVAGALAYFGIDKFWFSKYQAPTPPAAPASAAPAAFAPPPHSIAVLPFVNMSGDEKQEYFSDGLTEEILNSLARINELQVSARTSAFSFKGKDVKIGTIARELNVGAVLEGSVRRSGHTVRVTAQLNNAVTGFHLWSQTYDRDLSDVLALQTEIANAVASALKVALLGDVAAKIAAGGTRDPAAFDAYLRASKAFREYQNDKDVQAAIAGYTEAIRLDPEYALAYADQSLAYNTFGRNFTTDLGARREYFNKAQVDARKAIALAQNLAQAHLALASLFESSLEFIRASQEYERALALEPGEAQLLKNYGWFAVLMGQTDAGLAAAQRAVALDPLNSNNHFALGGALVLARRPREAIAVFTHARALTPNDVFATSWLGAAYRALGDLQSARAAFESIQGTNTFNKLFGLAMTYDKLGRHTDAEAMLTQLRASGGDDAAVFYSEIYTQWGDTTRALGWLETAMRRQDPYLEYVKVNPLFDPLRKEPRFHAIERELKFPN